MRRARRAALLAACAALASPFAWGQKPARSPVLGILSPFYRPTPEQWARLPTTPAFAQLGWVAGKTFGVEFAFGQGREDLLSELARELVRKRVDVIWARGPEAAVVAAQTTKTIPIVFTAVAWPVEMGLADSLARPGRNSTGVAYIAGDGEQTLKPAEYLRQIAPEATRIVSLWSMHNLRTVSGEEYGGAYPAFESGMRALGFDYRFEDIKSAEGYEAAFANILASRAQAIIALTTALNFRERKRIVTSPTATASPAPSTPARSSRLAAWFPTARIFRPSRCRACATSIGSSVARKPAVSPSSYPASTNWPSMCELQRRSGSPFRKPSWCARTG